MNTHSDGSLEFRSEIDGKQYIFTFEKKNYEAHRLKRPKLGDPKALKEIEETIQNPDCITVGPRPRSKRNYYKVFSYEDFPSYRFITYWHVVVFCEYSKEIGRIATCIEKRGPNYYAIHDLEEIIWKSPNSQI